MRGRVRRKLDAIQRVYALSRLHGCDIAGYVEALDRLGERLAWAESLSVQQEEGDHQAQACCAVKDDLRRTIEREMAHLARIARALLPDDGQLRLRFTLLPKGINRQTFLAHVRAMLQQAAEHRAVFIRNGMPETFVEDLQALLDRYLDAVAQQSLSAADRVGAVAELPEVAKEMMQLVRRLDAINQLRWQDNAELLAAWRSARKMGWPRARSAAAEARGEAVEEEV